MAKQNHSNSKQRLKRRKIKEGEVVAIPATDGRGYLVAVVARAEDSYSMDAGVLVYIFAPRWDSAPKLENIGKLDPDNALSIVRTGVIRIFEGRWPVIGILDTFNKADWPIPIFGGISLSAPGLAWLARYSEDRVGRRAPREEWQVSPEEARRYPADAANGVDVAAFDATKKLQEME